MITFDGPTTSAHSDSTELETNGIRNSPPPSRNTVGLSGRTTSSAEVAPRGPRDTGGAVGDSDILLLYYAASQAAEGASMLMLLNAEGILATTGADRWLQITGAAFNPTSNSETAARYLLSGKRESKRRSSISHP